MTEEHYICNQCGADITSDPWGHINNSLMNGGNCGSYHSTYVTVKQGYYETVTDQAAYDEQVLKLRGIPCDGLSILLGKGKESVSLFVRVGGGIGTILAAYLRIVGGFLGSTKGHDHLLTRGLLLSHCFCLLGSVPLLLIMALPPVKSTFPATSEPQIVLRLPCDEV